MLIVALGDGAPGNPGARRSEDRSDGEAGEDFETSVTVGMIGIGGFGGDPKAEQDETGHQDVGGGFEAVGDQGYGLRGQAHSDFYRGEGGADGDADHRGAAGGLFETPHASGYSVGEGLVLGVEEGRSGTCPTCGPDRISFPEVCRSQIRLAG